jgi:hypothetical protein
MGKLYADITPAYRHEKNARSIDGLPMPPFDAAA